MIYVGVKMIQEDVFDVDFDVDFLKTSRISDPDSVLLVAIKVRFMIERHLINILKKNSVEIPNGCTAGQLTLLCRDHRLLTMKQAEQILSVIECCSRCIHGQNNNVSKDVGMSILS